MLGPWRCNNNNEKAAAVVVSCSFFLSPIALGFV